MQSVFVLYQYLADIAECVTSLLGADSHAKGQLSKSLCLRYLFFETRTSVLHGRNLVKAIAAQ